MNVFHIPEWEISAINNKSAKKLFSINVRKALENQKIKNLVAERKNNRKTNGTSNFKNKSISPYTLSNNIKKCILGSKISYNSRKKNNVNNNKDSVEIMKNNDMPSNKLLAFRNEKKIMKRSVSVNENQSTVMKKNTNNDGILLPTKIFTTNRTKKNIKHNIVRTKKNGKPVEDNHLNMDKSTKNKIITNKLHNVKTVVTKKKNNQTKSDDKASKTQRKKNQLLNLLNTTPIIISTKKKQAMSLKERMTEKLKASRFRYINEQIYNSESKEAQKFFHNDPDAFYAYHEGYRQQVSKWPLNPLDVITKSIKKMPTDHIIADFGCGEAYLAKSVPQKVYSFDLVSVNEYVTACDMSNVPLENDTVDVVVFCLSLMGTNIREYLFKANRVLKNGGMLKIAEVESRFDTVDLFIEGVKCFGFMNVRKDLSHNLFYFLDFKKVSKCKPLNKLPTIGLYPCLYKKR